LVMGLIVVLRYAFQVGSIALQESVMYLNALIFTFGAAYTLKNRVMSGLMCFITGFRPGPVD